MLATYSVTVCSNIRTTLIALTLMLQFHIKLLELNASNKTQQKSHSSSNWHIFKNSLKLKMLYIIMYMHTGLKTTKLVTYRNNCGNDTISDYK